MGRILDSTTVGFLVAALVSFVVAWAIKGYPVALAGVRSGLTLFFRYLILIASSMVIASLFQVLIPSQLIARYLGTSSGWRGLALGTLIGALTPGSPYSAMPLFAGFMRMGAGVPTGVSMVCAWGLLSIGRVPFQAAVLGSRFTLVQVVTSVLLPVLAGATAYLLKFY